MKGCYTACMDSIVFAPLIEKDIALLHSWHQDSELSNRIGGKDWPKKLWEILSTDLNRKCWTASMGGEIIGYVDFEIHPDENIAWIGLAVKPELRKQGFGKRILEEFLKLPFVRKYKEIKAGIEPDNVASMKCFVSVGFEAEKLDGEGIMDYSYKMHRDR